MRTKRIAAGYYSIKFGEHTWYVYRLRSDYGDTQWMIDRDDKPCWGQADTYKAACATIARYGAVES